MEPFAYENKKQPDPRKRLLLVLAAACFSGWYFNLVPELVPVSTGSLEDPVDGTFTADDFAALLGEAPGQDSSEEPSLSETESGTDDASAFAANSADAIEDSFPEFGNLNNVAVPPSSTTTAETTPDFDAQMPQFGDPPASVTSSTSGIQPASFETAASPKEPPTTEPVLSAELATVLNEVDVWIEADEILEAHAALSRMYWKKPELRNHLYDRLNRTAAEIYANPSRHFADPYQVQFGETLDQIALKHSVPWQYLARLNRVTPESLQAGQTLKVLNGPFGAVVDLQDKRMTLHAHGWYVRSYDVGVGKDHSTPAGEFTVQEKVENPTWYNPDGGGGVIDADDPANPLGEYWIGLGNHIGIHGTIDPNSIGASVSRGCIHLGDSDITEVYNLLGRGSQVVIRP